MGFYPSSLILEKSWPDFDGNAGIAVCGIQSCQEYGLRDDVKLFYEYFFLYVFTLNQHCYQKKRQDHLD